MRERDREAHRLRLLVRPADQIKRRPFRVVLEVALDRHDFHRLIFIGIEPVLVAATTWIGATRAAIHIAIENIVFTSGVLRPLR